MAEEALEVKAAPDEQAQKPSSKTAEGVPIMHVRVASPFKTFFDENAQSISGVNGTGAFDILPHHHNFISLLSPCELSIVTDKGTSRIKISGGIMHVKADQVVVFLNV
ncbi:MAG TPA: hypothetical protein VK983_02950 [Candidatus Limnocylindrales bacterium]|nr:hypothetical protein [Candidatus Limnocylindrales bacterium]